MNKLLSQIAKFGIVGVIAFIIDFAITMILSGILREPCLALFQTDKPAFYIASFCGFCISLVFNYIASMTFVFKRREGTSRREEFVKFTILSIIGLILHEVVLLLCMGFFGRFTPWLIALSEENSSIRSYLEAFTKVVATGVVMVFNFITRKIFLEQKDDAPDNEAQKIKEQRTH